MAESLPDEGHVVRSHHEGHLVRELLPVVTEGPREVLVLRQTGSEVNLEGKTTETETD